MKRILFHVSICLIIILCLSSCAQMQGLQTGQVVESNNIELGLSLFAYGIYDHEPQGGDLGTFALPYSTLWGRTGFGFNMDMGFSVSTAGNAMLDLKYQFIGDQTSKFAMSIGGGAELQLISNLNDPAYEEDYTLKYHVPLFASYHPSEKLAYYINPRFVYQDIRERGEDDTIFLGLNGGLKRQLGKHFDLFFEAGVHIPNTINDDYFGNNLFLIGVGCVGNIDLGDLD